MEKILKDALKLKDIDVQQVERKKSRNEKPGVVIVKVGSKDQCEKVLGRKRILKSHDGYKDVYINADQSQEVRSRQNNVRTILREIGKEQEYIFIGENLVKRKKKD